MNDIIILCSRIESSRFPRKVFHPIAGMTALDHILSRLGKIGLDVVLAIPHGQKKHYREIWNRYSDFIIVCEGNAESPLHRMAEVVNDCNNPPEYIVRVTHDDILIDASTVLNLLDACRREKAGYGFTPSIVEGAGVEVIHRDNLLHAAKTRKEPTEFVSYFVKGEGCPKTRIVRLPPRSSIARPYRLTMDYPEDATVLDIVLREVGAVAPLDEVVKYLDENPHILKINRLPKITFYTCAKNAEKTIGSTMRSVLNSGIEDMEYIVIDDGSDDKTLFKMSVFAYDIRVKLISNSNNLGLASSSNLAIEQARGKWIMRVDADDMILLGWQDKLIQFAEENDADVVYPSFNEIVNGRYERKLADPREKHHAGCTLMKRSFLNEVRFKDGIKHWDSLELYKRIEHRTDAIYYFDAVTWLYRKSPDSMSSVKSSERNNARKAIG